MNIAQIGNVVIVNNILRQGPKQTLFKSIIEDKEIK